MHLLHLVVEPLAENHVLGGKHSLAAYVVGIHPFPSARHRAAMEYHAYAVVVGIAEDVLVQAHCLLFVAAEEVHLDALYAYLLHPFHRLLALYRAAHHVDGALHYVVPPSA